MNCKVCGSPVEENTKFCPNCGSLVEEAAEATATAAADSEMGMPTEENASVNVDESPVMPEAAVANEIPQAAQETPVNTIPTGVPNSSATSGYGMPGQSAPNYGMPQQPAADMGNLGNPGMGYDPTVNPIPPMTGQPPKKKKKKVWLIVLLCLIPVVLIIGIVVGLFCYGMSLGKKGSAMVDEYWDAYVNCDAEAMADMVPDDYWDYISNTYEVTEEEAVAGMQCFLEEKAEELGGNLTCDWDSHGVQYAAGTSSDLDEVREVMDGYGLSVSSGVGISITATVTGDSDSEDHAFALWDVKIDGEWYNGSVMTDFDAVCSAGYADNAKYMLAYGDTVSQFYDALFHYDGAALGTMVPDSFWNFIEEVYEMDRTKAEGYLSNYLEEQMEGTYDVTNAEVKATVTDAEELDADEITDMNSGLEEHGLSGEEMIDIYADITLTDGDKTEDDSSYITLTKIDGNWYVYDVMYYFADACGSQYEMYE